MKLAVNIIDFAPHEDVDALKTLDAILVIHGYRTGSNYFSAILENNDLGRPVEYFNHDWQTSHAECSDEAIRRAAVERILAAEHRGVFATKLAIGDFCWLTRAIGDWSDPLGSIARRFRRCVVIVLQRDDIFLQAVSFWRAHVTGEWVRHNGASEIPPTPDYDLNGIYERYVYLSREGFIWRELLERSGVAAIRLNYEEIIGDRSRLRKTLAAIADQIDPDRTRFSRDFLIHAENAKQADRASEAYRSRFITDFLQTFAR